MRPVPAALALLVAATIVWSRPWSSVACPVDAAARPQSADAVAAADPTNPADPAKSDHRRAVATDRALATPSPAPADADAGPIVLVAVDAATRQPLPDLSLRVYVYGERHFTVDLRTDAAGRAVVGAADLSSAANCAFSAMPPEFDGEIDLHAYTPVHVLRRQSPFPLAVPRGIPRLLTVVDELGRPVAGATAAAGPMRSATTAADGRAQLLLPTPPPHGLEVDAPGHRRVYASTPPGDEPFTVTLPRANRLEIELVGTADPSGFHVDVHLDASFTQRQFPQRRYEQTPGRAVDGTPGEWAGDHRRGRSQWSCGFPTNGIAVLDQLDDDGAVDLVLWHFGELLERRHLDLAAATGPTRVRFVAPPAPTALLLTVRDGDGAPLRDVRVRAAPHPGAVIPPGLDRGFPAWSPLLRTAADGTIGLAQPRDTTELVVLAADGYAVTALPVADLAAAHGAVALQPGRVVTVEVRGRDGSVLTEGITTGYRAHVRPRARLSYGLWLDPADGQAPEFAFTGLPLGLVEFRFDRLSPDEVLWHDTTQPHARHVAEATVDELQLGK